MIRPLLLAAAAGTLAGADLLTEMAAWAPLPARSTGLIAAEERPATETYGQPYAQAIVIGGSSGRFAGLVERRRDGATVDAQATFGLARGRGGHDTTDYFTASWRNSLYLRAGTDPLAADAGSALIGGGGGMLASIGGGPFLLWADVAHSDERGLTASGEVGFLFYHLVLEHDEDVDTLRHGFSFRWPGGTLARSPQASPWSFAWCVDWARSEVADRRVSGLMSELTLGWRILPHVLLVGQLAAAEETLQADGDDDGAVWGSLGVGATF